MIFLLKIFRVKIRYPRLEMKSQFRLGSDLEFDPSTAGLRVLVATAVNHVIPNVLHGSTLLQDIEVTRSADQACFWSGDRNEVCSFLLLFKTEKRLLVKLPRCLLALL